MSFWNFIGEFALFNTIWNMFSGKPKHSAQPVHPIHTYTPDADYQNRIEELNQEIRDSKKRSMLNRTLTISMLLTTSTICRIVSTNWKTSSPTAT